MSSLNKGVYSDATFPRCCIIYRIISKKQKDNSKVLSVRLPLDKSQRHWRFGRQEEIELDVQLAVELHAPSLHYLEENTSSIIKVLPESLD